MREEKIPFAPSDTVLIGIGPSIREFGGFNQCTALTGKNSTRWIRLHTDKTSLFCNPREVAILVNYHPFQPYPDGYCLPNQVLPDTLARNFFYNPERTINRIAPSLPLDYLQRSVFPPQTEP